MFYDFIETDKINKDYRDNLNKKYNKASDFNLKTDEELKNYKEKHIDWLVQKIIKSGSINIIGAKRASCKSWLGLNLAYCFSVGKKFLGKFDCSQGNVLYLDRENGFSELKHRSLMTKKGLNIDKSPLFFLSETTFKLDNPFDIEELERFVVENDIKIIILDTYRRVISFKEDSADEVSRFFVDTIKPISERTGVSFIFIHHEKKGESSGDNMDMLRGSSDLVNYADSIIQLKRKGDTIIIEQTKQRGAKELEPFQVKIETDERNYFNFDYIGKPLDKVTETKSFIVRWIFETGKTEFTYTEVLKQCEENGYKQTNFKNALNCLVIEKIVSKGEGKREPYVVNPQINMETYL